MARIIRGTISDRFNGFMIYSMLASIIIGIVGVIMILLPSLTNKLIGVIVGIMFLVSGASAIYKYLKRDGAKLYSLNLVFGLIMIILGLVIILVPFSVTSFITVCLGLYLIVSGSNKITYGIWFKIGNDSSWLITFVIGIMLIIFGIMVLANPFSALTITKLVGVFLLAYSILDITDVFLLKKRSEEIVKIFW